MECGLAATAGGRRVSGSIGKEGEGEGEGEGITSAPLMKCSTVSGAPRFANNNADDKQGENHIQCAHTKLLMDNNNISSCPRRKRRHGEMDEIEIDHEMTSSSSGTDAKHQACGVAESFPSSAFNTLHHSEQGKAEEAGLSLLLAASLMQQTTEEHGDDEVEDDDNEVTHPQCLVRRGVTSRSTPSPTFPHLFDSDAPSVVIAPSSHNICIAPALPAAMRPTPTPQLSQTPASLIPLAAAPTVPIESICDPTEYDVLCGRGGDINRHVGNIMYRRVVDHNKTIYKSVSKRRRILVSQSIVQTILNHGGRFLQQQLSSASFKEWTEIPFRRAVQKTSQALREQNKQNDEASASDKVKGDSSSQDISANDEDEDLEEMRKPAARPMRRGL